MSCPPILAAPAPAVRVIPDIHYGVGTTTGAPKELFVDAYLLDDGLMHPPVLMIHGGGFTSGKRTDADLVRMAYFLARCGYACFLPNYRLMDESPVAEMMSPTEADTVVATILAALGAASEDLGYKIRGALIATEDVHKARVFLGGSTQRAEYRIANVPWGVLGQSAGGITALFTAYAGDRSKGGGYWDKSRGIGESVACCVGLWGALPIDTIVPPEPPMLLVHGTLDPLLPFKASTYLVEQCGRQGVTCERITMDGAVHGHASARLFDRSYRKGGTVMDRIASFLAENLNHQLETTE